MIQYTTITPPAVYTFALTGSVLGLRPAITTQDDKFDGSSIRVDFRG